MMMGSGENKAQIIIERARMPVAITIDSLDVPHHDCREDRVPAGIGIDALVAVGRFELDGAALNEEKDRFERDLLGH